MPIEVGFSIIPFSKTSGMVESANSNATNMIRKGTIVQWSWGNGTAKGTVEETYTSKITKTIKGTAITRNGEKGNKALFIEQNDGDYVLKNESEVERAD